MNAIDLDHIIQQEAEDKLLSQKSRGRYENQYDQFCEWLKWQVTLGKLRALKKLFGVGELKK